MIKDSNDLESLKKIFSYPKKTNLSKAIVFAALDINKPTKMLPIKDYRENRFSLLWKETFSNTNNWTPQFRTEFNQGNNRLANRLFEGRDGYYRLKDIKDLRNQNDAKLLEELKHEYTNIFTSSANNDSKNKNDNTKNTVNIEEIVINNGNQENKHISNTEVIQDANLISLTSTIENTDIVFQHKGERKEKIQTHYLNGKEYYPRDPKTALNALSYAKYLCEVDPKHKTFLRKNGKTTYTEPHHLVPLSAYKDFNVSLDVEENIVSLCSHCHNLIHYGNDSKKLIEFLYKLRKDDLEKVGIIISLDELLNYY